MARRKGKGTTKELRKLINQRKEQMKKQSNLPPLRPDWMQLLQPPMAPTGDKANTRTKNGEKHNEQSQKNQS
jgi:hypothetical protein